MMSDKRFFDSKDEAVALTTQLKMLGVAKVGISFQGSGDSGEIDYIELYNANSEDIPMPTDMVAWTKQVYGEQKPETKQVKLRDALEDIGYRVLDETGMDWYNNEGGQGYVYLNVDSDAVFNVNVDMEINITQTEDHEFLYDPNEDEAIFYPVNGEA
jgi:hypothetical protein